jgi:hypothetical protein
MFIRAPRRIARVSPDDRRAIAVDIRAPDV